MESLHADVVLCPSIAIVDYSGLTLCVMLTKVCFISRDAMKERLRGQREAARVNTECNSDVEVSYITFNIVFFVLF